MVLFALPLMPLMFLFARALVPLVVLFALTFVALGSLLIRFQSEPPQSNRDAFQTLRILSLISKILTHLADRLIMQQDLFEAPVELLDDAPPEEGALCW